MPDCSAGGEQALPLCAGVVQQVRGAFHRIDRPPLLVLDLVHAPKAPAGHFHPVLLEVLLAEDSEAATLLLCPRSHGIRGSPALPVASVCVGITLELLHTQWGWGGAW